MRRFESTGCVRLQTPAGRALDAWVADSFRARLVGLALLPGIPGDRALLLPRCRSVHTAGMRFPIDVAFVGWPPTGRWCEVAAVEVAVPPLRIVAPRGTRAWGTVAALETAAGTLSTAGISPGVRLGIGASPGTGRTAVTFSW